MESNNRQMLIRIFFLCLIITFLLQASAVASFERKDLGSIYIAGGSAGLASLQNDFAVFLNPAQIPYSNPAKVELFYKKFFGLEDLNLIALNSTFRLANVPVGLGVSRYGNKLYNETEIRVGSSYQIMDSLSFGVTVNGYMLSIARFGNAAAVGFDLAGYYRINSSLSTAFNIGNLNEPKIGHDKERIPLRLSLGLTYRPLGNIEINADAVKDDRFTFDYRIGMGYQMNSWLTLLGGFKQQTNQFAGGFLLVKSKFYMAYSLEYHPNLNASHGVTVGYEF